MAEKRESFCPAYDLCGCKPFFVFLEETKNNKNSPQVNYHKIKKRKKKNKKDT